jgi:phosphatidylglycerophosphate synthase
MTNWHLKIMRMIAQPAVNAVVNVRWITPNRISYFRLLLNIPQFFCFAVGGVYYIIGCVIYEFTYYLDCMDGQLARARGTSSQYGHWLEVLGDRLYQGLGGFFGFFVAYGVWHQTQSMIPWVLLAVILFGKYADRALVSMQLEDKSPDQIMTKMQEENVQYKKSKLFQLVMLFDSWHFEIVLLCALFYYPLGILLPMHPVLLGMWISAVMSQVQWVGRFVMALRYFIKNKLV